MVPEVSRSGFFRWALVSGAKIPYDQTVALFIGEITCGPVQTDQDSISKTTDGHKVYDGPQ